MKVTIGSNPEGNLVEVFVDIGQEVEVGDPLFEAEDAKAAYEVESPVSGKVKSIEAAVGDALNIDTTVLRIEEA